MSFTGARGRRSSPPVPGRCARGSSSTWHGHTPNQRAARHTSDVVRSKRLRSASPGRTRTVGRSRASRSRSSTRPRSGLVCGRPPPSCSNTRPSSTTSGTSSTAGATTATPATWCGTPSCSASTPSRSRSSRRRFAATASRRRGRPIQSSERCPPRRAGACAGSPPCCASQTRSTEAASASSKGSKPSFARLASSSRSIRERRTPTSSCGRRSGASTCWPACSTARSYSGPARCVRRAGRRRPDAAMTRRRQRVLVDPHPYPGRLIAVEGIDGSGKSTQLVLLERWLKARGHRVHFTEWNSSPLVRRSMRRRKKQDLLTPTTFSLLHAVDFADRLTYKIMPPLKAGMIVLADRYVFTAFGRDVARGAHPEWVRGLYTFAPRPDLTLYFRVPIEVSLERLRGRRSKLKYHEAGMDLGLATDPVESFRLFQSRVLDIYDRLTGEFGLEVMDATAEIKTLQKGVRRVVQAMLRDYDGPRDRKGRNGSRR